MISTQLKQVTRFASRRAGFLFLMALAGVLWHNRRLWEQNRITLSERCLQPLPAWERWPTPPFVTVLVAAWNEKENLGAHLQSFLNVCYPHKELILCVGGEDGSYQQAKEWAGKQITVLEQQPGEGKYRALKRALPHAKGTVIYLTDADCILNSESFEQLLYPIASGQETITTGLFKPFRHQQSNPFVRYQWAMRQYAQATRSYHYLNQLAGANCMLQRSVVEAGWQVDEIAIAEDLYLGLQAVKAGHRILQVRHSVVETEFPESYPQYMAQQTRWLRGLLLFGAQMNELSHVRHVLRTAFIGLILLIMPLMSLIFGKIGYMGWLLSWSATAVARVRYMWVLNETEQPHVSPFSSALLTIMLTDFVIWSRVLFEMLREESKNRW